jgi:hypothetical protein
MIADYEETCVRFSADRQAPAASEDSVTADEIQPRPPRDERRLMGYVVRSGSGVAPAVFENVSEQGCCIIGDFQIGECFVVTLPKIGTCGAQVRWAIGGRAGLRFDSTN